MDLADIRVKSTRKAKRLGRGTGSGKGKTSGRGHKGAGQRKGKRLPYEGFRGGILPYIRVIPKRGFTAVRKKVYQIVNLSDIQEKVEGVAEINPEVLSRKHCIKDERKPVKILASGEKFTQKVTVKADKFSRKAKQLIEAAGGRAECLNR